MDTIYNEYLLNMRNLVKEFIDDYKDINFNDEYKSANEFLLNYSFYNLKLLYRSSKEQIE